MTQNKPLFHNVALLQSQHETPFVCIALQLAMYIFGVHHLLYNYTEQKIFSNK